jgi:hypothetical protein
MRGNVAPLYVHLSQNGGTLLEQMRDATNQSKAALVEEGLRMLSRSDLTRLRKQPLVKKEAKRKSAWMSVRERDEPASFFTSR